MVDIVDIVLKVIGISEWTLGTDTFGAIGGAIRPGDIVRIDSSCTLGMRIIGVVASTPGVDMEGELRVLAALDVARRVCCFFVLLSR